MVGGRAFVGEALELLPDVRNGGLLLELTHGLILPWLGRGVLRA